MQADKNWWDSLEFWIAIAVSFILSLGLMKYFESERVISKPVLTSSVKVWLLHCMSYVHKVLLAPVLFLTLLSATFIIVVEVFINFATAFSYLYEHLPP